MEIAKKAKKQAVILFSEYSLLNVHQIHRLGVETVFLRILLKLNDGALWIKRQSLKKVSTKPVYPYGHYFCSSLLFITGNGWKILSDVFIPVCMILKFLIFWKKKKKGHIFKSDFIIKLKWFQERSSEPSHFSKSFQIWFSILKGILCRFNQFLNRRKPSGKVWGICTEVIYGGRSDVNLHLTFFPEKERCHRQER